MNEDEDTFELTLYCDSHAEYVEYYETWYEADKRRAEWSAQIGRLHFGHIFYRGRLEE